MRLWIAITSALTAVAAGIAWAVRRPKPVAHALIVTAEQHTTYARDGAVRSIQAADLILPTEALESRRWGSSRC